MEGLKGGKLLLYSLSTAGWVMLDSLWLTFSISFLLPPKERVSEGMILFISNERFFGIITMLGAVMVFGRIIDAIADPLIASCSDRSTSKFGRRRFFLIIGGLPLAIFTVLIFFPPLHIFLLLISCIWLWYLGFTFFSLLYMSYPILP